MTHFHVFLGAPSRKDLQNTATSSTYHWEIASTSSTFNSRVVSIEQSQGSSDFLLGFAPSQWDAIPIPQETYAEASRRISLFYQNTIFKDNGLSEDEIGDIEGSQIPHREEESTANHISWSLTQPQVPNGNQTTTFLHTTAISMRKEGSTYLTQGTTQDQESYGGNTYSDASSIARFPTFHIPLNQLSAISTLTQYPNDRSPYTAQRKFSILAAILEIEGPESITIKKSYNPSEIGKQITLLKLIVGDEEGGVCKLTVWREVAETWGGIGGDHETPALKRGDVVLFQNLSLSAHRDTGLGSTSTNTAPSLTASPTLKSSCTLCYRTMPFLPDEDRKYRPDLRLGISDMGVRKVANVVEWFERMAGLR
ncbi:hypothetical protein C8Q75DRAFT_781169 [Abortiporus biennis]|nr:hypothetical protein C8Q75DRAFT_781169 [Abortiporus biennis]